MAQKNNPEIYENPANYLANPYHPKTQELLKQLNNIAAEEFALKRWVHEAVELFYAKQTEERKIAEQELLEYAVKKQKSWEDAAYHKTVTARSLPQHATIAQLEQQKAALEVKQSHFELKIKELETKTANLYQAIAVDQKEVNKISSQWEERQAKIEKDFLQQLQEKNIAIIDATGKEIAITEYNKRLSAIPKTPTLAEQFSKPDLKHLLDIVVKLEGGADKVVVSQIAHFNLLNKELLAAAYSATAEEAPASPTDILKMIKQNKVLGQLKLTLNNANTKLNNEDVENLFFKLKKIDDKNKEIGNCSKKINEVNNMWQDIEIQLKEINKKIALENKNNTDKGPNHSFRR